MIWHTTSLPESLRGMGYWTAYTELGFGGVKVPFFSDAGTLLFDPLVLVASLLRTGAWLWRASPSPGATRTRRSCWG